MWNVVKSLEQWLDAAAAARPLCENQEALDERIAEQEARLRDIVYSD